LIALLAASAFYYFKIYKPEKPAPRNTSDSFMQMKISPITSTGNIHSVTISRDGKWLAYTRDEKGGHAIWVRQVGTGSTAQVVPGSEGELSDIVFSPDGNYLYYRKVEPGTGLGFLFKVPSLGGTPIHVITDVDSAVTFSPDGKKFAFIRNSSQNQSSALLTADLDGGNEQTLATVRFPDLLVPVGPGWSEDGKLIAIARSDPKNLANGNVIETFNLETHEQKQLGNRTWANLQRLSWLPDDSGLIFTSPVDKTTFNSQIWELTYPDGEARRITNDLNYYAGASITGDGATLATVQWSAVSSLWISAAGSGSSAFSAPKQITSGIGRADGEAGVAWPTPDQIIYTYYTAGALRMAFANPDGSNVRDFQFNDGTALAPRACGDGAHFIFMGLGKDAKSLVYRADVDGSNIRAVSPGPLNFMGSCSPDGKFLVYMSVNGETASLMKVGIDGGTPQLIATGNYGAPAISPDGASLAVSYQPDPANPAKLAVLGLPAGEIKYVYDAPAGAYFNTDSTAFTAWSRDGRLLLYPVRTEGVSNLWAQPVGGATASRPRQITNFTSDRIISYALSPDGKQIVFARGNTVTDAVLISNFH
jgi:Tol biopolymer transport system component